MCGIIGYIGDKEVVPILLDGLERLEYRGYDSAGIVTISQKKIHISRCIGKIADLKKSIATKTLKETLGSAIPVGLRTVDLRKKMLIRIETVKKI